MKSAADRRWAAAASRSVAASAGSPAASNSATAASRASIALGQRPWTSSTRARRRWSSPARSGRPSTARAAAAVSHVLAASPRLPESSRHAARRFEHVDRRGERASILVECPPVGARGVPIGMHAARRLGGAEEPRDGLARLAGAQPVLGHDERLRAAGREDLGDPAMLGPPLGDGRSSSRTSRTSPCRKATLPSPRAMRIPRSTPARRQASLPPPARPRASRPPRRRGARPSRAPRGPRAPCRRRGSGCCRAMSPGWAGRRATSVATPSAITIASSARRAAASSSTNSGRPWLRSNSRRARRSSGRAPRVRAASAAVDAASSGTEDDLVQPVVPPQLDAQAPDRARARQLVGPVDPDDEQRLPRGRSARASAARRCVAWSARCRSSRTIASGSIRASSTTSRHIASRVASGSPSAAGPATAAPARARAPPEGASSPNSEQMASRPRRSPAPASRARSAAIAGQPGWDRIAATSGSNGAAPEARAAPRSTIGRRPLQRPLDERRLADPGVAGDEHEAAAPPPRRSGGGAKLPRSRARDRSARRFASGSEGKRSSARCKKLDDLGGRHDRRARRRGHPA